MTDVAAHEERSGSHEEVQHSSGQDRNVRLLPGQRLKEKTPTICRNENNIGTLMIFFRLFMALLDIICSGERQGRCTGNGNRLGLEPAATLSHHGILTLVLRHDVLCTNLEVQQQALCNESESGPVRREKDQPLFLEKAGQHLESKNK